MKGFASSYLSRQRTPGSTIPDPPSENIGFIVVIPVLCEPGIIETLRSLWDCKRPSSYTEVLIVVNSSVHAPDEILNCNQATVSDIREWIAEHPDDSFRFFILDERLPEKDAGVGMARKIGMDEALRRFNETGNHRGFILSFDGDSTCDPDYFTAIEDLLINKPATKGFEVYFEHPVAGNRFSDKIYKSIVQYELHLRYVNIYLKHSGFPYAHHTIGSCFGVRADVYAAQGGMNKRKGGEDFYFLHKVIPLGNFEKILTTRVIPSPRDSFRVPFGTGPVIRKLSETGEELLTYSPETFRALSEIIRIAPLFYGMEKTQVASAISILPENLKLFLELNDYLSAIEEINANTGSPDTFLKRFFAWFDAFRVVKYLNYTAANFHPKQPVNLAVCELLRDMGFGSPEKNDALKLLYCLRNLERTSE